TDRKANSARSAVEALFSVLLSGIVTPKPLKAVSRPGRVFPTSGDETDSSRPGSHIYGALVLLDKFFWPMAQKDLNHARSGPKARAENIDDSRKSAEIPLRVFVCRQKCAELLTPLPIARHRTAPISALKQEDAA